jgi:adenylyltransferase/sulfurtransferase
MTVAGRESAVPVIAIVGAGGIGQPAIRALAGSRVTLRVIDDDRVEVSNLHRQILASDDDVGRLKVDVVAREMRNSGRNDDRFHVARVTPGTARELLDGADVVIEGSDNYATKFLVADACALLEIPAVHGAAVGWLGTVLTTIPGRSACYRCVFEEAPGGETMDCATAGVFGPVTSVIGALMAADALRVLHGDHRHLGSVGSYDGWRNTFRSTRFAPRRDCPLCGTRAIQSLDPARYVAPDCGAADAVAIR